MNSGAFNTWLQTAKPGESCVYFRGVMTLDDDGRPREKPQVAEIAWRLAIAGAVGLTQRRTGEAVDLGGNRMPIIDHIATMGKFKPLYPSFPYPTGEVDKNGRIRPGVSKP